MNYISTENAPQAIGPYSQAIVAQNFVYCSGQIPCRPDGSLVGGTMDEQARQVLQNLKAVLEAAGSSLDKVVKVTVYLTDISQFEKLNNVYSEFFSVHKPARATVEVAKLPKNVMVEMDCIAVAS